MAEILDLMINTVKQLEFDLSSNCNAQCPQCPREQPSIKQLLENKTQEVTLENVKDWFSSEFLGNLEKVIFKGSFSDPMMAKEIYEIVEYFVNNTAAQVDIHTNGSSRKPEFWKNLGNLLQHRGQVVFGLDGLEDTHAIYRVNTNFNKIIENATAFIAAGGYAIWQFIIFKHNEHQIETAKQLANDLKFKEFFLVASVGFEEQDSITINKKKQVLEKTENYDTPSWAEIKKNFKNIENVTCKSKQLGWIVVDFEGEVFPCCMTQVWKKSIINMKIDSQIWYKKVLKNPDDTNLHKNSLDNILSIFNEFYNNLNKKYIPGTCAYKCGNNKLPDYKKHIVF